MAKQPETPRGQRGNAVRVHRLIVWFFAACALVALGGWTVGYAITGVKALVCLALALGNHLVARAATQHEPWAQWASLALAGLMLVTGGVFFFARPDVQGLSASGAAGSAFVGSFVVVLAITQVIAAIYILLNGNWQQPNPPEEGPDSNLRP